MTFKIIFGLVTTLSFDLLISESNQFMFVPKCTQVVNLATFHQAVYRILCSQTFTVMITHGQMDGSTDSPETECLQWLIASKDIKSATKGFKKLTVMVSKSKTNIKDPFSSCAATFVFLCEVVRCSCSHSDIMPPKSVQNE